MTIATASAPAQTTAAGLAGTWQIDPSHSAAHFSVRHMMIANVRGTFDKLSGTVVVDGGDPLTARVEAEIDVASIDTRDGKRDEHLRSPDFFDAAAHPKLTFRSKRIEAGKGGAFRVHGDLTIRGVTKTVVLDVEAPQGPLKNPWGQTVVGVTATTKIDRKDFGLQWNVALEAGGFLVGDEVKLQLDVELARA